MTSYWFFAGGLAVWRVSHLLTYEDGPAQAIVKLRGWIDRSFLRGLTSCFYCISLWVALPAALLIAPGWSERLLIWPALSGAAILLERITSKQPDGPVAPPVFFEDEVNEDVLRSGKNTIAL